MQLLKVYTNALISCLLAIQLYVFSYAHLYVEYVTSSVCHFTGNVFKGRHQLWANCHQFHPTKILGNISSKCNLSSVGQVSGVCLFSSGSNGGLHGAIKPPSGISCD